MIADLLHAMALLLSAHHHQATEHETMLLTERKLAEKVNLTRRNVMQKADETVLTQGYVDEQLNLAVVLTQAQMMKEGYVDEQANSVVAVIAETDAPLLVAFCARRPTCYFARHQEVQHIAHVPTKANHRP